MQSGNLIIRQTKHGDDGEYRCYAMNEHGIAFGLTMKLQVAGQLCLIFPFSLSTIGSNTSTILGSRE